MKRNVDMRRWLKILILLLLSQSGNAQVFQNRITGRINEPDKSKYAYLFIKKIGNDGDSLLRATITDKEFTLNAAYDVRGRLCAYADIFYSADSTLTLERVKQMYKNGYHDYRTIVLEDIHIETKNTSGARMSRVIAGKLNKEFDLYLTALDNGTELDFIKNHPGSPISLLHLKARYTLDSKTQLYFNEPPFDFILWFNRLDAGLRASVEGLEFNKLINNK